MFIFDNTGKRNTGKRQVSNSTQLNASFNGRKKTVSNSKEGWSGLGDFSGITMGGIHPQVRREVDVLLTVAEGLSNSL